MRLTTFRDTRNDNSSGAGPVPSDGEQLAQRLNQTGRGGEDHVAPGEDIGVREIVAAPAAGFAPVAAAQAAPALPDGFDAAGFERTAKLIFIRMQAANDAADLNDLRAFTTPEMFAAVKLDLQERQGATQQTDVVQLNAQVVDHAQEAQQQIVSVRFHGLIREEKDAAASPFDEVWHLVKPNDGSREWAIAGIAPYA